MAFSLCSGRQVSPWQPSSLCGQTVTPSPHYELGFTHCQPPALPMGLGLPHSGRLLMAAQPLRWLAARRAPSGTWTIRPTCCRRSESPLPLPVTVSCGVCLNQAEGPLIPAHVASVLEVRSWQNADLSLPHRCLEPRPSGASREGLGGWLARHFRYGPGQVGWTATERSRRGFCLAVGALRPVTARRGRGCAPACRLLSPG